MSRILILLLVFLFPFLAIAQQQNPYPLSVTEGNAAGIVDECVSAVSGIYFETFTNLVMPGPEPLVLSTSYASIPFYGWSKGMYSTVTYEGTNIVENNKFTKCEIKYIEPSGAGQFYSPKKNIGVNSLRSTLDLSAYGKGFTNSGRGEISARTHPKNTVLLSGFNNYVTKPNDHVNVYAT